MEKTINVSGTEVYINGDGKEVLVMIHGWPDTHEIWSNQVAFFKNDFKCVTFTLPGFEKGDNIKYTLDDIINRIKSIVDTVSPNQKINLLVHDWGCVFGYEYAMRNQNKIEKMIGIDVGDASSKEFFNSLSIPAKLMAFSYQFTLALGWLSGLDFIQKSMAKALKARSNMDNIHAGMGLPYAMKWLKVNGGMTNMLPMKPNFPFFYTYGTKKPFMFHSKKWLDILLQNPKNKVQSFNATHWVMIDKANEFNIAVKTWLLND